MSNDNILEQQNQSLVRQVRRLKWVAQSAWAFLLLVFLLNVAFWLEAKRMKHRMANSEERSNVMVVDGHGEYLMALEIAKREATEMRQLFAFVQTLGGRIEVEETSPYSPIVGLNLSDTELSDNGLFKLCDFDLSHLRTLNVKGTRVTDAGIKKLKARLPHLTVLR